MFSFLQVSVRIIAMKCSFSILEYFLALTTMFRVYSAHELGPHPVFVIKSRAVKKPGCSYCMLEGGFDCQQKFLSSVAIIEHFFSNF